MAFHERPSYFFFLSFLLSISLFTTGNNRNRDMFFSFFFWGRSLDGEPPASDWPLICVEKKKIKSEIIDRFIEHLDDQDDERC